MSLAGKDPTKVDRSGAYIVRQAAKSIVAAGLARRVIVQVSYAIGVAQPLSVHVDSYGTGKIPDKQILAKVLQKFDFRPGALCLLPPPNPPPLPAPRHPPYLFPSMHLF